MPVTPCAPAFSVRRSDRPAHPVGGVFAHVRGRQFDDARLFAHRLRRFLRGQSWAEKSLKNGRFLVEFQKLRKPQDAKGTYFPRNSPSALLEWGSGGRWFESSRPDIVRPVAATSCGWPFFHLGTHSDHRAELRAEIRASRTIRYPSRPA